MPDDPVLRWTLRGRGDDAPPEIIRGPKLKPGVLVEARTTIQQPANGPDEASRIVEAASPEQEDEMLTYEGDPSDPHPGIEDDSVPPEQDDERCELCGGTREHPEDVAANFGVTATNPPDIRPCPDEFHTASPEQERGESGGLVAHICHDQVVTDGACVVCGLSNGGEYRRVILAQPLAMLCKEDESP